MKRKIYILLSSLVILAVLVTGLLTHNLIKDNYLEGVEENLVDNGLLIKEHIKASKDITLQDIIEYSKSVKEKSGERITYVSEDGTVIFDTNVEAEGLENHGNRPEIKEALNGEIGASKRYSNTLKRDLFYVALPCDYNELGISVIRLAIPLENIIESQVTLYKQIVIASSIGIIISFLFGLKFVGAIIKPINELNEATQRIADGNFYNRVYINSDDELADLASNFNKMSYELELMIEELNDSNNVMNTVLSSMENALVAVNNKNEILFLNRSFEQRLGINEIGAKDKNILDIIENDNLRKHFKELIKEDGNKKLEFTSEDGKIYNIYSTNILEKNDEIVGQLITLQDVTDMKKLEKMRSDFVANVSHELRTPLTSIRGFIDTLKDGAMNDEDVRERFLDIIDMEVSRLGTLIEDVLVLSDIENNYLTAKKEKIDLAELAYNSIDMLKTLAKKKDINLKYNFDENIPMINANKSWTKQMIINLVDNAIKYSNNDTDINVNLIREFRYIVLEVEDNGIGIDKEDLDRLFERFYRVDKARSRELGGTGLGLAIVKHVVLALNGTVDVDSELGKGTKFTIRIPINQEEV